MVTKIDRSKPEDAGLTQAVAGVLATVPPDPRDEAARLLALKLAAAIDRSLDPESALKDLGPKLLAVLVELQCTPKARGAKGVETGERSALDELTQRRTARKA